VPWKFTNAHTALKWIRLLKRPKARAQERLSMPSRKFGGDLDDRFVLRATQPGLAQSNEASALVDFTRPRISGKSHGKTLSQQYQMGASS
jgi:hypothetical protein